MWAEDPKPAYQSFSDLYTRVRERVAGESDAVIRSALVEPVFRALGFTWVRGEGGEAPDYVLSSNPHAPAVAGCLVCPWDRYLDGKDDKRDATRGNDNPGARVVSVLDSGTAAWNIVTNGKLWRLYHAEAHSRATNYYEIDLEETLALTDLEDRAAAFRYFWLIFRAAAFVPRTLQVAGEQRSLSFLDELIYESSAYAKRLGKRLKDRIFDEVFPEVAAGSIGHIKHHDGLTTDPSQERLDEVFRGALALLYRLLFLLYAEARVGVQSFSQAGAEMFKEFGSPALLMRGFSWTRRRTTSGLAADPASPCRT